MADSRSGASSFLWFLIGLFLGIVGTFALLIWKDQRPAARPVRTAVTTVEAPPRAAPAPAAPKPAAAPARPVSDEKADAQVAEDAAAAGMTSRPKSPEPAAQ